MSVVLGISKGKKVIFMVSTPPKHPKNIPPLSPPLTVPGTRAGSATVQNFLQVQSYRIILSIYTKDRLEGNSHQLFQNSY